MSASIMDDNDSVISDLSVMGTPHPFRELPISAENSLHTSSSSDAVIRALQTLQLKIKKLELERVQAEKNFGSLEKEANTYKDLVNKAKVSESWASKGDEKVMYRLQPTNTSTPTDKEDYQRPDSAQGDGSSEAIQPQKLSYNPETDQNISSRRIEYKSDAALTDANDDKVEALLTKARALYCPSSSQPYATYVRPTKDKKSEVTSSSKSSSKKQHDSKVSILEKQLEYMRRLVHNAEQERVKATERMCAIEQEKENQVGRSTKEELERQNKKIAELEMECYKLNTAHNLAEGKIQGLEGKLHSERQNHEKLMEQTEQESQLARVTEENKNLMLSITPSLPPSPDPPVRDENKKKKKRKRPSSTGSSIPQSSAPSIRVSSAPPADLKRTIPFVCGRSAHPSHSLTANVQQMLSALKHENPARCARISTKQRTKKGGGSSGKEIKQVISGLEDDLGALTFELQKISSVPDPSDSDTQKRLSYISDQMEKKVSHIKKLKSCLKKLENESKERVVRAQAVPSSRPLSNLSNREVQICVRGSNTRELLTKVKNIRDVLSNKDLQWI
ncbi:centrosomal protein cep57l1-like isoform X1 [Bolinopsis microptera]|uniref:centrosomal protein cep57l1-like isoform X1 n=1 Tax=Bolinopsis microptera TaxID=2820187 RepID=UPI00307A54CD